jgi:hypothetical protein
MGRDRVRSGTLMRCRGGLLPGVAPGVDDSHTGPIEVAGVSGQDGGPVPGRGRGDQWKW